MKFLLPFLLSLSALNAFSGSADASRLAYLEENDPFYVGPDFPRLTTRQWVGEPGVEAVVILGIDDMRDPQKYEAFLRPILERLKKIDGRAPVSIMCNALDPQHPRLQTWLKEGLSLEAHTLSHPCPLLAQSNFTAAAETYHGCVDLLNHIPGNRPVAFRMPCCDSMNSPSPRFYAEIFNRTNSLGQFLTIDSSVMNITTSNDKSFPRELGVDANGRERFRKYVPFQSFATTIEDYPYPYVIGKLCWEFPAMAPSDWEAQNIHGTNNPVTVADWKAALDVTVIKQGTFTFIFHPHGWIRPDQLVEFIDYAVEKYGRRVKFLNFREAQERIDKNLLLGQPLRAPNGQDNGVRLLDVNNDGFMDVVIGNENVRKTRVWKANEREWQESNFPVPVVTADQWGNRHDAGVRFGIVHSDGSATILVRGQIPNKTATSPPPDMSDSRLKGAWHFAGTTWNEEKSLLAGLELEGKPVFTSRLYADTGVRLRDVDHDGRCELIVSNDKHNAIFSWSVEDRAWTKLPYALPGGTSIVNESGQDNGLRFVDLNGDGYDDVVFSNERSFAVHLFIAIPKPNLGWERGWSFKVAGGNRGELGEVPMIARGGSSCNNGAWFHSKHLWVQNEDTAHLADKVDRRSFIQLLTGAEPPAKSPEESLACIHVRPGFKVELVASEPLVVDPVAFEWDGNGKLWVVEMRDYPLGMDGKGKPGGVVKYLEDTDGDGHYDKATLFLEGVNFPNGVMPWRKGILVSAAPEIFYAEDTDGDGRGDLRKPLLTGFSEGNQQHRINGFEYGLDNWIYAANGGSGGKIRSELTGRTANLRGHDLRFRPDTGAFEIIAGQTQFGRRRDDWGNWFGNENPTWVWHYFLPEHYLARNPDLAVKTTRRVLANYPGSTRVFPISRPQQRFNWADAVNSLTSANSPTPYRDELFGPEFATSVFISEPAHNLVHREMLHTNGVTFTSRRAADEQDREFLASSDNWFRPTMLKTGPDGALYIADMYRLVIEHPEYFPEELKSRPDLRAGDDKGRIYRVYPEGARLRKIPRLGGLASADLVTSLVSTNGWQRDTAQRLLIERGDSNVLPELLRVGANERDPRVRLNVLSALEGLGSLTPDVVSSGLGDSHASVREFAVRLSEPFLRKLPPAANQSPPRQAGSPGKMEEALLRLVDDPNLRVRYQLALTLGEWNDPRAGRALARIALKDRDVPEMQPAVLSSGSRHAGEIIEAILSDADERPPPADLLAQLLGLALGPDDRASLTAALKLVTTPVGNGFAAWQMAALAGFLDALDRRKRAVETITASAGNELNGDLNKLFAYAREKADDMTASEADRLLSIRLLGRRSDDQQGDIQRLKSLLRPQVASDLQLAALNRLKQINDDRVARVLLEMWRTLAPGLRAEALNVLLSRPGWTGELLSGVQSGTITPVEIGPAYRQQLMTHPDNSILERAKRLFGLRNADRQKVVRDYSTVSELSGDPEKGAVLYRQNCMVCHRLKGEGNSIGPDLETVADKPVGTLVVAILDPNQAFESRYINYIVATRNGRELSGIIVAETPNSITIRNAAGGEEVVLRGDISEMTSSRVSLMPEGFESILKLQDMADLIAYIRAR